MSHKAVMSATAGNGQHMLVPRSPASVAQVAHKLTQAKPNPVPFAPRHPPLDAVLLVHYVLAQSKKFNHESIVVSTGKAV